MRDRGARGGEGRGGGGWRGEGRGWALTPRALQPGIEKLEPRFLRRFRSGLTRYFFKYKGRVRSDLRRLKNRLLEPLGS